MTKIYKTNGEVIEVKPKNSTDFIFGELSEIVGGNIGVIQLSDRRVMIFNEQSKMRDLPFNELATMLSQDSIRTGDYIAGDVLVCDKNQVK